MQGWPKNEHTVSPLVIKKAMRAAASGSSVAFCVAWCGKLMRKVMGCALDEAQSTMAIWQPLENACETCNAVGRELQWWQLGGVKFDANPGTCTMHLLARRMRIIVQVKLNVHLAGAASARQRLNVPKGCNTCT